jgi:two-component system, chemotaxis family, chemotaxis protein CheY
MAEILVIDDHAGDRHIAAEALACAGHSVWEATNGAEGIALCRKQLPSLVITDIVMAGKDGIETIRELRQLAPSLPILAVSGNEHSAVYLSAVTLLGADAVLAKPFNVEQLIATVERLVRKTESLGERCVRPEQIRIKS